MELGEWIGGRIIENSDNRGSNNRVSTVPTSYRVWFLGYSLGRILKVKVTMTWSNQSHTTILHT